MTTLFFSYSHADSDLRDQLEKHLAMLKRQGRIDAWHDRKIVVGDSLDDRISEHLQAASIVLLLVSSDFLSSEYCYSVEMQTALKRHHAREARVIPVILRPCDWKSAPFADLLAAPTDARPVTKWTDRDEAWLDVVEAIKKALPETASSPRSAQQGQTVVSERASLESMRGPRSSNLRLRKEFSDADRSKYLKNTFEYMSRFFSNSLEEIQARNPGVETEFTRIDAQRFSAVIYRSGKAMSQCQIRLSPSSRGGFGAGISFSYDLSDRGNSFNESLAVETDDQAIFLRPLGMSHFAGGRDARLSEEGAAELYWGLLIDRLQS